MILIDRSISIGGLRSIATKPSPNIISAQPYRYILLVLIRTSTQNEAWHKSDYNTSNVVRRSEKGQ